MRKTGNAIVDLSFKFALDIIDFVQQLEEERKFIIASQLLKSGTSIGANVKEADETEYWLLLCQNSKNYPFSTIIRRCESITKNYKQNYWDI